MRLTALSQSVLRQTAARMLDDQAQATSAPAPATEVEPTTTART